MSTLIKFEAPWCGPCKQLDALLKSLEIEHTKVDVEADPAKGKLHQIRAVPTLVILDANSKEVSRKVGMMSKETLLEWLDEHGVR